MTEVRREVGLLSDAVGGLGRLGRLMTFGLTIPLVAFGATAMQTFSTFEAEMHNIASISTEVANSFDVWSQKVREFGETSRYGPQGAAESMYELVSAGYQGAEAFDLMTASIRLSEANVSDLDATTRALAATMMAYHLETSEATRVSDIWTRMVQVGVGRLDEFIATSSKVLPFASAIGLEFEEVGAAWAYVSQQGFGASKAGTALGMALSNLMRPNEALREAMQELGVQGAGELIEKFGGLDEALIALRNSVDGNEDALAQMFSKTGVSAVLALTNDVDALNEQMDLFYSGLEGATLSAWQEQMLSFAAQFDLLKSAVQGFMIVVGGALAETFAPVIGLLTDLFLELSKLSPETIKTAVAIGMLVAAAGPLLWLLGSLLGMLSPLNLVIAGIGAFILDVGGIRTALDAMIPPTLRQTIDDLITGVETFFSTLSGDDVRMPNFAEMIEGLDTTVPFFKAVEFTVEPGDTPGQLAAELGTTVQAILDATGATSEYTMPVGTFTLDMPSNVVSSALDRAFREFDVAQLAAERTGEGLDQTLGGRLSRAVEAAWPQVSTALGNLKNQFLDWFNTVFIPSAINWAATDGAAGIGQMVGLLAGAFTSAFISLFADPKTVDTSSIPQELQYQLGQDFATPNLWKTAGDNLISGFRSGVEQALQGATFESIGDAILGNILAGIATVITLNAIVKGLTGINFGGIFIKAVGLVLSGASALIPAITALGSQIITGLATFLTSSVAIGIAAAAFAGIILGVIINAAFQGALQELGKNIIDTLFGPGAYDNMNREFERTLRTILGMPIPEGLAIEVPVTVALPPNYDDILLANQLAASNASVGLSTPGMQVGPVTPTINWQFDPPPGTPTVGEALAGQVTAAATDPALTAATQQLADTTMAQAVNNMAAAVAAGEVDPSTISTAIITPLETAFTLAFGEGGTVATVWDTWITGVTTDFLTLETGFLSVKNVAVTNWNQVAATVNSTASKMKVSIFSIVGAIQVLIIAIKELQGAIGALSTTNLTLPTVGGAPGDGPHATGGSIQPGGTFAANEMFTTSRSGFIIPASAMRGNVHGGGAGTVNNISIYEVPDVDGILYEFKRRGIRLEGA